MPDPVVSVSGTERGHDTRPGEDEGWVCDDYPEHDYVLRDERDGDRVYDCRRCGAELIEVPDVSR